MNRIRKLFISLFFFYSFKPLYMNTKKNKQLKKTPQVAYKYVSEGDLLPLSRAYFGWGLYKGLGYWKPE